MEPPPVSPSSFNRVVESRDSEKSRQLSYSQTSDDSHTAAEFIDRQLQLEAEAREALPYRFNDCTRPLGSLRQIIFACLTCNPRPLNPTDPYSPAGVCYSCSIQCHGEHQLVELFTKRNFTCDCGTTRLPRTAPCTLRLNPETNTKGAVHSEAPELKNKYNQNFGNRFCGCECDYDPEMQVGTMFQCLGLGTAEEGGCGEDWWHPGCIAGLDSDWFETASRKAITKENHATTLTAATETIKAVFDGVDDASRSRDAAEPSENAAPNGNGHAVVGSKGVEGNEADDFPLPPGFPREGEFEGFICYKCVEANPWIKRYAGHSGFLAPVFRHNNAPSPNHRTEAKALGALDESPNAKKREAEDDGSEVSVKRARSERSVEQTTNLTETAQTDEPPFCKLTTLPAAPRSQLSLFFEADFRDHMCRCSMCFPNLAQHPQLLEEEATYNPPLSESGDEDERSTAGSGSIYDRGESALKTVDRVRAIEGVMAYNHLKEKLKPFFQQFAESGKAISAEDIKAHFAKIRGDEHGIEDAGEGARSEDYRQGQSGY